MVLLTIHYLSPSRRPAPPRGITARSATVIQAASHFAHYEKPGPVTNALLTHFQATVTT